MLTVSQAQQSLLSGISPLEPVRKRLLDAHGYVLAEDVFADINNPPFTNSAVDGYAVAAADTCSASPENPVRLRLAGEVAAGSSANIEITSGVCARILTGAPLPNGADSVVMQEDIAVENDLVRFVGKANPGDHVRVEGEDIRRGDRVLASGAPLGPGEIALLAAMGQSDVQVRRRPRVAILTTGDELVEIGTIPGPGQIRNSNAYALAALVKETNAEVHSISHVRDELVETEKALVSVTQGPDSCDLIVTSGGVSVGDRDYVKPVVERLGALDFWRVNMKPGKPFAFGSVGRSLFFGLPGNPVSTMVTFELFVRPALRKLAGHTEVFRPIVQVQLQSKIERHPGREEYMRAAVRANAGGLSAKPTGAQGSAVLGSMLGANALLVLPADSSSIEAETVVRAILTALPISGAEGDA